MIKKRDDLYGPVGGSFTAAGTGSVAAAGNFTLEDLKSMKSKMQNLLEGTFPPHQGYGGGAFFGENFLDRFGSPSPRLSSFVNFKKGRNMIGIVPNLMGGSGGPGLLPTD